MTEEEIQDQLISYYKKLEVTEKQLKLPTKGLFEEDDGLLALLKENIKKPVIL